MRRRAVSRLLRAGLRPYPFLEDPHMKSSYFALATAALVGLAACAGESTSPSEFLSPSSARFAVGATTDDTPQLGVIKVCKEGNAGGSFDVTRVAEGASTGTVSGLDTPIASGECVIVAEDNGGTGIGSTVTITEDPAANTVSSVTACTIITDPGAVTSPCAVDAASRFVNSFHGYVVTYTNTFTPPPVDVCTYTKGWYRNNGSNTIIDDVDDLTIAQQQQVFNATPGKPGNVTWTGGNNTLNLYQQLLAAINNLGGDEAAGPNAVDAAIIAAKAGLTVTTNNGGVQITLEAGTDVSGLIATLSAFNEGTLVGFPHCTDEVLPL
jgi:hypothetical protein